MSAETRGQPSRRGRWLFIAIVFTVGLCAAFGRAIHLQVGQTERLSGMASRRALRAVELPGRRGDIFDRRGVALAQSVEQESIWVDPEHLEAPGEDARRLAAALGVEVAEVEARIARGRRFAWLERRAHPDVADAVRALDIPGVGFVKEPRRFYPQRELAAHVLGFVGTDAKGLEGLELSFEDELSAQQTQAPGWRDARGRKLLIGGIADAEERTGASVWLTLDRHIQYLTENALASALTEFDAEAGMAVVLRPSTGEILALANAPGFNPNAPPGGGGLPRNRSVLDVFEPGSTIKPLVAAAALDEGVIQPDDLIDCEDGAWRVGGHTIHDTHPHGQIDLATILRESSNIGMGKIGHALGTERLHAYLRRFGFGGRFGVSLPAEGRGSLPDPRGPLTLATQAFGQGMSVTALQLAVSFGALANGGVPMKPHLVSRVVDPDGLVLFEQGPTALGRAVSARSADAVLSMLEAVVGPEGTAPRAAVEGYRVAGKTGTAQKPDPVAGGYSDKRIASFVGVIPADRPELVIAVVVDEPERSVYGGVVAAPAFREIARGALPYLGVSSQEGFVQAELRGATFAAAWESIPAAPGEPREVQRALSESIREIPTEPDADGAGVGDETVGEIEVPELRGRSSREAVSLALARALEPRLLGSGSVVSQTPAPGARVEKGSRITLVLTSGAQSPEGW